MDIRLYIDNMKVDLNNELQILFNWQESDLSNPTVIKNGYSKTIVLQGTDNNNEIFGHFWNLERYLVSNSGNTRTDFNPSYRVPFTLYYNGSIYEKGYVKLQRVIRNNGVNRYEIGLFGGLGTFLYNLSTDWNTGVKKSLADLNFFGKRKPKIYSIDATIGNTSTTVEDTVEDSDTDLSFTINADTILNAWNNISNNSGKWSVINFAPTYNGFPSNIDTDKVLINFNNMSGLETSVTDGTSTFTAHNGYALGKLPSKLTMEETKDYRSYLQTPIVRTKSIIDAICMKENNNGKYDNGYEVVLDEDFFNPSNPYYWDSWITLPKLNLSYTTVGGTEVDLGTVTPSYDYTTSNGRTLAILVDNPIGTTNKIKVSFDLQITVPNATADRLYLAASSREWSVINALAIQAYASNSLTDSEYIFGSSSIEWLTNKLSNGTIYTCDYAKSNGTFTPKVNNTSNIEDGSFVRVAQNIYRWNRQIVLECDLPENANVIKIDFQLANSQGSVSDRNKLCTSVTPVDKNSLYTWSMQSVTLSNSDMALIKASTENFYSNQVITKDALLTTSYSPAEFLVSFCKMFGLYLHKDIVEDKIYITTRNNFYKRDNIINLEDIIDLSKDLEINPVYVDTNYVSLTNKAEESASIIEYKDKYGKEFGQKVVDTGFEFNADTKELNNGVFKTAVQAKEQSQYFYKNKEGKNPYVYNGFNYTLYQDGQYTGNTKTVDVDKKEISAYFDSFNDNFKYYDVMSKAQFEDNEHKGLPTENVFLFFNGYENVNGMGYYLTDDVQEMSYLNNKPCWLMTNSEKDANGKKIAIAINNLPRFSRYFEGNHWMMYSFDYGSPRELFVPDIQNNDEGNIYHIYFKNYFEDLYDVNTKVVTCYIKADDLTEDTLRNIYWFRNGLWRINKIYDYNPLSPNTTKCEFIKIQDLANFDIEEATKNPWVKIKLDKYYIGQTGGTIVGTVRTWDNYGWQIEGIDYNPSTPPARGIVTVTPEYYGQSGNFVITVPANIRDDREVLIDVTAGDIGSIVSFRQPGVQYSFGVSPTEFNVEGDYNSEATLNITNPYYYDWSVTSIPEWINITPSGVTNGQTGTTGNTACTITVAKNTSEERTGTVVIEETTYGKSYSITVKQKAAATKVLTGLTIDNFEWTSNFPYEAGTYLTKDYSTFNVIGHYNDGTTEDLTTVVDITGEVTLEENTSARPRVVEAPLMAHYMGLYESVTKRGFQNGAASPLEKPLTFNINSGGTINWAASDSSVTKTIEYKLNGGEWVSITSNTGASAPTITVNTGDKIKFRGSNTSYSDNASSYSTFGSSTASFEVEGNIMSLINSTDFATLTALQNKYTFNGLFNGCTGLTSAENLILPATTLAEGCYYSMFTNCAKLTKAPKELPSDTLTTNCYAQMFWNCKLLTVVPKLSATKLATYCYSSMFAGCKSLITVPDLPATTLATNCYASMFKNCTSITTAPALPATTLATSCYRDMFYNCTSLTSAPALPATTLEYQCYNRMFYGCKSLTQAPVLPATTLANRCYYYMFEGCSSLATAPELPATNLTQDCYNSMFSNCTSLTTAPELPAEILYSGCYSYMFYGCTKLKYIKCLATDISATNCTSNWVDGVAATGTFVKSLNMSEWTTGINGIPEGWTVLNYVPSLLEPKITSIDADIKNN